MELTLSEHHNLVEDNNQLVIILQTAIFFMRHCFPIRISIMLYFRTTETLMNNEIFSVYCPSAINFIDHFF